MEKHKNDHGYYDYEQKWGKSHLFTIGFSIGCGSKSLVVAPKKIIQLYKHV